MLSTLNDRRFLLPDPVPPQVMILAIFAALAFQAVLRTLLARAL